MRNIISRNALLSLVALVFVFSNAFPISQAIGEELDLKAGAKIHIKNLIHETLTTVAAPELNKSVRRENFKLILHKYFAFEGLAKWVLGRYWRKTTEAERAEYLSIFEKYMVLSYADRLGNYGGEEMLIDKTEIKGEKDALVHTKLERLNGEQPVKIVWRVRCKSEVCKIVDVMVSGLSMGLTQQKEFTSVIRKNGGKISGLLTEIRNRVTKLSDENT